MTTLSYSEIRKENELLAIEEAVFFVKEQFQCHLKRRLNLHKVSAPLFVSGRSGIQDNLNGTESPVSFRIKALGSEAFEIVHSLAKWKRFALMRYDIPVNAGIYTDMKALRPDEQSLETGFHSVYVDQWDWEKVISPESRNLDTLKDNVRNIYDALKETEEDLAVKYGIRSILPEEITFIHSEDLVREFPLLSPRQRETEVCRRHKAVFLIGIGATLEDGNPHDGRAPDYDDWSTPTFGGRRGLNGDILLWNPCLECAFEISSMGIRVDSEALYHQLETRDCTDRIHLPWHNLLLSGKLPQSIGGGIGQSRLCMFMLRKAHIGEVQSSVWPETVEKNCVAQGLNLL